jgi:hypothetical protein
MTTETLNSRTNPEMAHFRGIYGTAPTPRSDFSFSVSIELRQGTAIPSTRFDPNKEMAGDSDVFSASFESLQLAACSSRRSGCQGSSTKESCQNLMRHDGQRQTPNITIKQTKDTGDKEAYGTSSAR